MEKKESLIYVSVFVKSTSCPVFVSYYKDELEEIANTKYNGLLSDAILDQLADTFNLSDITFTWSEDDFDFSII